MRNKMSKLLSVLLTLVLLLSLAGPLAPSARAEGPYKVSLDDSFHGTVTADKDMADEGETVRLTVTPSEGYIIESVSVYAIDLHSTVPVTYSEGNYIFTMPASEVQASATFRPAAPATTEIPSVGLSLTLPAAGGSYSGAVPAAVSISSGTGFTVKSANWYDAYGIGPASFEAGEQYWAGILLAPAEGYAFTDDTAVTIDTLGVKTKEVVDYEADNNGCLRITTVNYTIPAAPVTHTVKFAINLGDPLVVTPPTQTVADGEKATEPSPAPEAFGCTFLGWYLGEQKYDFNTPVTGDITLEAKWDIGPEYYYHGIVVAYGTADRYSARIGTVITITANEPAEGKVFDKWVVEGGGITLDDEYSKVTTFEMKLSTVAVKATFKDAPAAPVTSYIFKGVSFELTGLNQLTSGSDAGKWMPATPIDWTKFLVSIDPGADSAILDSALVESHFDFLYTDAACTTILTGDMQDAETYYLRLVVNNKNAEDHSIDYSSLAAENCSASVAGYTASFVSASATTFAGKDAVGVVFSVTRNSTTAAPYTITVNGGTAHANEIGEYGDMIGAVITEAAEGDKVWLVADYEAVPEGKWAYGWTSEDVSISKGYNSFTMPAKPVTVAANYEDRVDKTYDLSSGTTGSLSDGDSDSISYLLNENLVNADQDVSTWDPYTTQLKIDLDKNGSYDLTFRRDEGYTVLESNSVSDQISFTLTTPALWIKSVTFLFKAAAVPYTVDLSTGKMDLATGQEFADLFNSLGAWTHMSSTSGSSTYYYDLDKDGTEDISVTNSSSSRNVLLLTTSNITTDTFVISDSTGPYNPITFILKAPTVTTYPVWVGGTQVTSANKDDILGDGGKAKYDPESKTLMLDNPTISGRYEGAMIYALGIDLTVKGKAALNYADAATGFNARGDSSAGGKLTLNGDFSVSGSGLMSAIWADSCITVKGGSVSCEGGGWGLNTDGDISIEAGTVEAAGGSNGINAGGSVTISGGSVTAMGGENGIRSEKYDGQILISGGTVKATGTSGDGISGICPIDITGGTVEATGGSAGIWTNRSITIGNSITKVTADGATNAIRGFVIVLGDALIIQEPAGGTIGYMGGGNLVLNGENAATHAVIVPGTVTPLPKVIGIKANVTGTQANAGGYDVQTDALETLFESSTAPVTMSTSFLYTGQACQIEDKLTTAPVVGTPYYFVISIDAYTDDETPTLEWADNATIKSGSTMTADKGTVEIVEIAHSPAGGSLSVICKYTETPTTEKFPVAVVITTHDKDGHVISTMGGTATADKTEVAKGETITVTVTPNPGFELESIEFGDGVTGGYQLGKETSSTVPDDFTTGTGKLQIDVVFKETAPATTHTVTFEANGGTPVPAAQTVADGEKAVKPADPTRSGVSFGGWYKDSELTEPFDFNTPITADITLYASWNQYIYMLQIKKVWEDDDDAAGKRPDSVDVKVLGNGTEIGTVTLTKDEGWKKLYVMATGEADLVLTCEEIVPEGYTLKDMTKDGDTIILTNQFGVTPPAPKTHTVTFEPNGGSAVPAQTVNDGEKAVKPADPTRSGFVFDGWYADATFAAAFDFGAPITADVTVYAKWTEESKPGEIVYTIVSGGNSTWTKGSSSGVTIVVKRDPNDEECFSHFTSVQIGSTTLVSGTDYTAVAGSTVITLNASALQKLTTGTKTVTINFDDGKAATDLTIKAGSSGTGGSTSPKTGDDSKPGLWLAVMMLSGLGIGGLVVNDKKRRYLSRH